MTKVRNRMVQVVDLLQSNCISWSPEAKSLRRRFHPLKDEKRSFESRRKCVTTGERPELSNFLIGKVLASERFGLLRAEISRYARPAVRRWTTTRAKPMTQEECSHIFPLQNRPEGRGMKPKKNQLIIYNNSITEVFMRRRWYFTLIELLIVIAIICIL